MGLQFTGDFASLNRFTRKVERTPTVLDRLNEQLAEEAVELVREGFDTSEDPYGKPWDPPIFREGRPMEDTGGLKAAWHVRDVGRTSFSIANAKKYSAWLHRGTGIYGPRGQRIVPTQAKALKLPGGIFRKSVKGAKPRRMVPDQRGLPAKWRRRFVETADEVLTALFEG